MLSRNIEYGTTMRALTFISAKKIKIKYKIIRNTPLKFHNQGVTKIRSQVFALLSPLKTLFEYILYM